MRYAEIMLDKKRVSNNVQYSNCYDSENSHDCSDSSYKLCNVSVVLKHVRFILQLG